MSYNVVYHAGAISSYSSPVHAFHHHHHVQDNECVEYVAPLTIQSLDNKDAYQEDEPVCSICLDKLSVQLTVKLKSCNHSFHRNCIEDCLRRDPTCPLCRCVVGEAQGSCPSGTMKIKRINLKCPGFHGSTTIEIVYSIPHGVQQSYHESPGTPYGATTRRAFLPDNKDGQQLLWRLKYAWKHGLTFNIGTSMTTGEPNVVRWASIFHKTSLMGGPFGFPDANFMEHCNKDLDALTVPDAINPLTGYVIDEFIPYNAPPTHVNRFADELEPVQVTLQHRSISSENDVDNVQGCSPSGTMKVQLSSFTCPGFGDAIAIEILYSIPEGIQLSYHENPGARYASCTRKAFLPDTDDGRHLLTRLKYAFLHGLIFTVGTSLTTGEPNVIRWGSIPHKTSLSGGPFGFPDASYIVKCNDALNGLGVPDADACLFAPSEPNHFAAYDENVLARLHETYRSSQDEQYHDTIMKLDDLPASASITGMCSMCGTKSLQCYTAAPGRLCMALLVDFKKQILGEIKVTQQSITTASHQNRLLHQRTHSQLDSISDVLGSLDARFSRQIPCYFVLLPAEKAKLRKHPRSWMRSKARTKYRLYFVCAHSYKKVKTPIKIHVAKDWVSLITPVLACSLLALQVAVTAATGVQLPFADTVFSELGAEKINDMLDSMKEVLVDVGNADLSRSLSSKQMNVSDVQALDKDAIDALSKIALDQSEWRNEVKQVRSGSRCLWVLNEFATPQNNYSPVY